MRVVHFIPALHLELGGLVRHVIDLANALSGIGIEVVVATLDPRDAPERWARDGSGAGPHRPRIVDVSSPSLRRPWLDRETLNTMRDLVEWADVLHLHVVWHPTSVQLTRLAASHGTASVLMVHGMLDDWSMVQKPLKKRVYLQLLGHRMLKQSSAVLCATEAERQQAMRNVPGIPMQIVPGILDLEPFEEPDDHELSEPHWAAFAAEFQQLPRLLLLSRFHHKKGIETLIDAAAILRDGGTPARVLIVGSGEPGYTQQLVDRVALRELDDLVRVHPPVYGAEKAALYASADLFVLPTYQENFGLVLFESLAAGTPVVTTKGVGTWKELLASGGVTLAEQTAQGQAAAIAHLLEQREDLVAMGIQGRQWVLREHGSERIAEHYRAAYQVALGRKSESKPHQT